MSIEWTTSELKWLNEHCVGTSGANTFHVYGGSFSYDVTKEEDGFSCIVYDENGTIEGNGQSDDLMEAIMNAYQDYINNSEYIDTARILIKCEMDDLSKITFLPEDDND